MSTRYLFVALAALGCTGMAQGAQASDKCSDALSLLEQNVVKIDTNKSMQLNTRDWFCSDTFISQLNNQSFNLDITIPIGEALTPFKFGADNSSSLRKRDQFCRDSSKSFSSSESINTFSQTLPPEVQIEALKAWRACNETASEKDLVSVSLTKLGGKRVEIRAKFQKVLEVPTPKIVTVTTSPSLKCDLQTLRPGKKIPIAGISDQCEWDQDFDATVIVHNSLGYSAHDELEADVDGKSAGTAQLRVTRNQWRSEGVQDVTGPTANCVAFVPGRMVRCHGVLTISVPRGRLQNLSTECVQNCTANPETLNSCEPAWNCPEWGAKAVTLYTEDKERRAVTGIYHWLPTHWPAPIEGTPIWKLGAEWMVEQGTLDEREPQSLFFGRQITFRVPKERIGATIGFVLKGHRRELAVGDSDARIGIELVDLKESGTDDLYTYIMRNVRPFMKVNRSRVEVRHIR